MRKNIEAVYKVVTDKLIKSEIPSVGISDGNIRCQTILYLVYWFHRLRNNTDEQLRIGQHLSEYIGQASSNPQKVAQSLVQDSALQEAAQKYVETLLVPLRTVDLVITKAGSSEEKDKEVLCLKRTYYPFGLSLPGGFILDSDEDNELNISPEVFAALRVAGEKVLKLGSTAIYKLTTDCEGKSCFVVSGTEETPFVRLYSEDTGGYHFRENIKSTLRPSDPRHLVDTVGFKCEVEGDVNQELIWKRKSQIMSPAELSGGFAFGHHREIVAQITAQTSLQKERKLKEHDFIRSIIDNPLEVYTHFKNRFQSQNNSPHSSFPELFPVVDRILTDLFTEEINHLCADNTLLVGLRDKTVISLRQVSLKNRIFCPYLPTLLAIAQAVAFFDLVARQKKKFYDKVPKDKIIEHNPREVQYASYHMYRYKYRFDQLLSMIPQEIIIPTYEPLSATDLLKTRGVPIRFVGITTDFLYVDEFEQSPDEFFMHDCNHSWRMIMEDRSAEKILGKTQEQLVKESNQFLTEYLLKIKISKTDTEEIKEIKKLKKIILFEIVHEDARPFLQEIICQYIQMKEGGAVPFEVPRIDKQTGYMDIVDTLDTGISTLSYVRNKLQHGFYDQVDAQLPQIVDPKYRTARWIAKAAYEMLAELNSETENPSYDWLLRRTCAVGPDNVHEATEEDPDIIEYGDDAEKLNPKRYQVS